MLAADPRTEILAAADGDEILAFAVFFDLPEAVFARRCGALDDLFVRPGARRRGIASAMLARLRALAGERGCGRFEWFVLDWNKDAQVLYDQVGAKQLPFWVLCRVDL